jgi:hypothetical protein
MQVRFIILLNKRELHSTICLDVPSRELMIWYAWLLVKSYKN